MPITEVSTCVFSFVPVWSVYVFLSVSVSESVSDSVIGSFLGLQIVLRNAYLSKKGSKVNPKGINRNFCVDLDGF